MYMSVNKYLPNLNLIEFDSAGHFIVPWYKYYKQINVCKWSYPVEQSQAAELMKTVS